MRKIDQIDQLIERITKNLSDYHDHIRGFEKQQIIDMACHINAMNDAHFYLTEHHAFDYEQAEYLLQFQNPLEIVADKWEKRISDISDMSFDLDSIFDKREAEQDGYALAEAGTSKTERPEPEEPTPPAPAIPSQPADVKAEAERIVAAFQELTEPNSPNKTHYAVPLSREFMLNAGSKDQTRLLKALPFKTKAMSGLEGKKGLFVTVAKDELQKPSILSRLADAKKDAEAQNKPGSDKSKKAERGDR